MKFSIALLVSVTSLVSALPSHFVDRATTTCTTGLSSATKNGVNYTVYQSCGTNTRTEYVKNSGICEKTRGVNQYSGYLSYGPAKDSNTFFWFFEARNNPSTAPLAVWINGGPGCSSMIGLFQENGPCKFVNGASDPVNNTFSWNNYANMLYIDQPVGTGFSYSASNTLVSTTNGTTAAFWNALQAFYAAFPQYKSRDLGLFSESYGGHYIPAMVRYIQAQNALIGSAAYPQSAYTKINIGAVGINDGWYDMRVHLKSFLTYGPNNKYRSVINSSDVAIYNKTLTTQCLPLLDTCQKTGTNEDCVKADHVCNDNVYGPIIDGFDFHVYDVRAPRDDPNPPKTYSGYLNRPEILKAIGARQNYTECSEAVYAPFDTTGDEARSSVYDMSKVVASGIPVTMWSGDADLDCNYIAGLAIADSLTWSGQAAFKAKPLSNYTVGGKVAGQLKQSGTLTSFTVNTAGHEIPFYQPAAALQVFKQTMQKAGLKST